MDIGNNPEQFCSTSAVLGFVFLYLAKYIQWFQQFSKD